jgi:CHAT domain-containing protein
MQQMGAKSVVASLWPVSDAVTPALMRALYEYRAQNPKASTAEALRSAQLTLLTGSAAAAESQVRRGPIFRAGRAVVGADSESNRDSSALPTASSTMMPVFTRNPSAPYAHPYYWAPFVLIGDWK